VKPIPFENTWPYEKQMGDVYFTACPYCSAENVLTNLSNNGLNRAKEGVKVRINLPCCHQTMVILEADDDYFWTNESLRK
jgi:hypothetical protein